MSGDGARGLCSRQRPRGAQRCWETPSAAREGLHVSKGNNEKMRLKQFLLKNTIADQPGVSFPLALRCEDVLFSLASIHVLRNKGIRYHITV